MDTEAGYIGESNPDNAIFWSQYSIRWTELKTLVMWLGVKMRRKQTDFKGNGLHNNENQIYPRTRASQTWWYTEAI